MGIFKIETNDHFFDNCRSYLSESTDRCAFDLAALIPKGPDRLHDPPTTFRL